MHGFVTMAHPLVEAVLREARQCVDTTEVVLCPPTTLIVRFAEWLAGTEVHIGGQDCHMETHGAFTGDISASMLMDADCTHVIVGHSERRQHHHESNADIRKKAGAAIQADLIPIICVGETADERATGKAEDTVGQQVRECLPDSAAVNDFVLAYEPVWAIGSGKTPTIEHIRLMHSYIASVAGKQLGIAPEQIRVLYGGSVKSANAHDIMQIAGVSGVLVGGASLQAEDFCGIIRASRTA